MATRHQIFFAAVTSFAVANASAVCADESTGDNPHILSMSGSGEVQVVPDQAILSAGVLTEAKTAAAALAANSKAMNEVFAALRKAGIPEKSIVTSNFAISPHNPPYKQGSTYEENHKIISYGVSNQVVVTLDDVSKVGVTMDALVSSGANESTGIAFSVRNPKPLYAEARANAVKDAIAKAEAIAQAAGVRLGPILTISEGSSWSPTPPIFARSLRDIQALPVSPPTPMAAGEQSLAASVSITWQIKQ